MCVVTDLAGRAVAELRAVDFDFTDKLNDGDTGTFTFAYDPAVDALLHPWSGMVGVEVDGKAIWLGVIVKRSGNVVGGAAKVTAMQIEGYLNHVWLGSAADDAGELDASRVVASRIAVFGTYLATRPNPRVLLPSNTPPDCGVLVEYEWASPFDGATWSGEPPTVLADIQQVNKYGVRFAFAPRSSGGLWGVELEVGVLPSTVADSFQVGFDVSGLTVEEDGLLQASDWMVVGDTGDLVARARGSSAPVLMRSYSAERVTSQTVLAQLADTLLKSSERPVVSSDGLELVGVRDFRAGQLVEVYVPAGVLGNWPAGVVWQMRVESVSWKGSGGSARTVLTLVQPSDDLTALTIPRTLVGTLRSLAAVSTGLAMRR